MHFFIKKLVLWPKDKSHAPRVLEFLPGKINLVTGISGTGKSAILAIVDYVLGSGKCAIPVGVIRTTVAWYGLLLDLGYTQMLVARKEPGSNLLSGDYHVHVGAQVHIPDQVDKNMSHDAFKHDMDKRAGLPSVDFDADESKSGFKSRPSFRDMAAFNFLPQYIVANPSVLFYKADTTEHRSKLQTIFPFVLGAIDAGYLAAEHEKADLERRFNKLKIELDRRRRTAEVWKAEAFGLHERARELGLIDPIGPAPQTTEQCIQVLRTVPDRLAALRVPVVSPGTTEQAARFLNSLREREGDIATGLSDIRSRIVRINALRRSTEGLDAAVELHAERVQGVGWFRRKIRESSACPVCGSEHEGARDELNKLSTAAEQLVEHQRFAKDVPTMLEREHNDLSKQVREYEEQLREIRVQRAELEERRAEAGGQRLDQVYRFAGRIEQSLENLQRVDDDGELNQKMDEIRHRLITLEEFLDPHAKRRKLELALRLVGEQIAQYARFLDLERAGEVISLKVEELTLVFESPQSGRRDYLWELGSGANWMGYHIATMLALHHRFLHMDLSYVPTFLMVDQPSQVYFPSGVSYAATAATQDLIATQKVFEALERGLRDSDYRLQIIVVEHADELTLGEIRSLHVVADWHTRDVDWLIPRAWM
jgi:hypothetical protein